MQEQHTRSSAAACARAHTRSRALGAPQPGGRTATVQNLPALGPSKRSPAPSGLGFPTFVLFFTGPWPPRLVCGCCNVRYRLRYTTSLSAQSVLQVLYGGDGVCPLLQSSYTKLVHRHRTPAGIHSPPPSPPSHPMQAPQRDAGWRPHCRRERTTCLTCSACSRESCERARLDWADWAHCTGGGGSRSLPTRDG